MLPVYEMLVNRSIKELNVAAAYEQSSISDGQLSQEKAVEFGTEIAELQELQTLLSMEVEILDLQIIYLTKCLTAGLGVEDWVKLQEIYNLEFSEKLELFVSDYKNLVAGRDGIYRNNQLVLLQSKAEKSQEVARYRESLIRNQHIIQYQAWVIPGTKVALEEQLRLTKANRRVKAAECEAAFNKRQEVAITMTNFTEHLRAHRQAVHNVLELQREELLAKITPTEQHPIYKFCVNGELVALKQQLPAKTNLAKYFMQHAPRALHLACEANQLHVLRFLLEAIGLPQVKDVDGYFPLHYAAKNQARNTSALLNYLLKQGALIDSLGVYGRSPLHTASLYGNVSAVQFLLQHGANADRQETGRFQSNTPLHNAAFAGHVAIVRILLEHAANPRILSKISGKSALLEAVEQGHVAVAATFLKFGIWLSAKEYANLPVNLSPAQKICLTKPLEELQQFTNQLPVEATPIKRQTTTVDFA
eukprot:TRINITY_DN8521_c0_g3_i2.p1 TRINITY_DN8521_c0_g3~~TRINITY_DN8521_c0_g3_i2.p1  ORF type:complete len:476 (+),score=22.49 TRINITY_DN8521_c0_g3_i2:124-1551(+)